MLLVVLGSLFLLIGVLAIYVERNIVDDDRFADRAVHALDDGATRDEIGAIVAEQLEQVNPDVIAFRAVIESGVSALAGTEPFKAALRGGVYQAHKAAFGRGEDNAAVTIANFGVLATETLRALAPDVAKEIPKNFRAELITFAEAGPGTDLVQIELGAIPIVAPILALMLLALAVLVANDRRAGLTAAALGVAAVGALGVIGFEVGRALVAGAAADAGAEAAVRALWSAMLGDLADFSLALCFAGIIVAGAAASLIRPLDVASLLRRARQVLERTPRSATGQAIRALTLVLAGVLVLVAPELAVRIVALAIGLGLAFVGASELLALIAGKPEAAAQREVRWRWLLRPAVVALLAALGLGGVIAVASADDTGEPPVPAGCNGSEALCERPLAEVTFPATHNAMSAADYPGFLFPMHDRTIPNQLHDGVRGLLIDAYYGYAGRRVYSDFERGPNKLIADAQDELGPEFLAAADRLRNQAARPEGESKLFLCHGFCELGAIDLTETLRQINSFVDQNPGAVILIVIEDYADPADIVAAFERSGLAEHAYDGPIDEMQPTLGALVDSGKQVVVLAENRAGGAPWYRLAYDFFQETGFDFKRPEDMDCAPNRGDAGNPLFLINNWINTDPAALPSNAKKVNDRAFLLDRARRCERRRGAMPNVLAVDFYGEGDVLGVAEELTAGSD